MSKSLLSEIEAFIADYRLSEHRFGILAIRNGRLVERLRAGRPILTTTEQNVRAFIVSERKRRGTPRDAA